MKSNNTASIPNDNRKSVELESSFTETLMRSNLGGITGDAIEASIDSSLGDSLLKELPVIRIGYMLVQEGLNIHDRLFFKKIISFLHSLKSVNPEQRQEMIDKISSSEKYRIKVGEKLLYIIDNCNDYETSQLVGILFKAYLKEEISYDEYLVAAETVSNLPAVEIKNFISDTEGEDELRLVDDVSEYIHSGLYNLSYESPQVNVQENDDHKSLRDGGPKYVAEVEGGDMWAMPSKAGKIIRKVLGVHL